MTPKQILQQFSDTIERPFFPEAAVLAAKAQWPAVWPLFERLMDQFIAKEELTAAQTQQLFFGLLLIADLAFSAAAEKVFELCDADDEFCSDLSELLEDTLTESLPTFFYLLAQGSAQPLLQLLHSHQAGIYVKAAALEALFAQLEALSFIGEVNVDATTEEVSVAAQSHRDLIVAAIPTLIKQMVVQKQDYPLSKLAYFCIAFGLDQFKPDFAVLLRQNKLDTAVITSRSINHWQLSKVKTPLASGRVETAFDIMSLQHWAAFRPKATNDEVVAQLAELEALLRPPVKEISKPLAGRNEACPCGSGKKYKKCCLG